jgi:hypothetical protein
VSVSESSDSEDSDGEDGEELDDIDSAIVNDELNGNNSRDDEIDEHYKHLELEVDEIMEEIFGADELLF